MRRKFSVAMILGKATKDEPTKDLRFGDSELFREAFDFRASFWRHACSDVYSELCASVSAFLGVHVTFRWISNSFRLRRTNSKKEGLPDRTRQPGN